MNIIKLFQQLFMEFNNYNSKVQDDKNFPALYLGSFSF